MLLPFLRGTPVRGQEPHGADSFLWRATLSSLAARGAHPEERLRNLPFAERLRRAREGGQTERTILERRYGKGVWEALLANAPVRRGLLTNPRLARALVEKVLRAMPAHELKLVPKQSIYGPAVRDAARRLGAPA